MAYSDEDINWAHDRADGHCFYCGIRLSFKNYGIVGAHAAWEIDHFIPLSRGGPDQPYNWVPACVDCNTRKSDLFPWEFDPLRFEEDDRDPDNYV